MTMRRLFGPCGGAANKDVPAVADVDESLGNGKDQGACAARKKAKGQGMGRTKEDGMPKKSSDKMKGDGQTLDGFNRRTGLRNLRAAPKCGRIVGMCAKNSKARWPPYSTISMETPATAQAGC